MKVIQFDDGSYNYINKENRIVSVDENFESVFDTTYSEIGVVRRFNGGYNFINSDGTILFPNEDFLNILKDFQGTYLVETKNEHFNIVTRYGKLLSNHDFLKIDANWSCNFLKVVRLNGLYNFIDTKGNILSANEDFISAEDFYSGCAIVQRRKSKLYNILTSSGKLLLERDCKMIKFALYTESSEDYWYNNSVAIALPNCYIALVLKENGLYNYVDKDGNFISDEDFLYARVFRGSFAAVQRQNNLWNFIKLDVNSLSNSHGHNASIFVKSQDFDSVNDFCNSYAVVYKVGDTSPFYLSYTGEIM